MLLTVFADAVVSCSVTCPDLEGYFPLCNRMVHTLTHTDHDECLHANCKLAVNTQISCKLLAPGCAVLLEWQHKHCRPGARNIGLNGE